MKYARNLRQIMRWRYDHIWKDTRRYAARNV